MAMDAGKNDASSSNTTYHWPVEEDGIQALLDASTQEAATPVAKPQEKRQPSGNSPGPKNRSPIAPRRLINLFNDVVSKVRSPLKPSVDTEDNDNRPKRSTAKPSLYQSETEAEKEKEKRKTLQKHLPN